MRDSCFHEYTLFSELGTHSIRSQSTTFYINPNETEVEGIAAYKSIREIPERPLMISVYVPSQVLLKLLPDIAERGCEELWLNPGTESDEVLAEAERLGLNVIQACSIVGIGVSPSGL